MSALPAVRALLDDLIGALSLTLKISCARCLCHTWHRGWAAGCDDAKWLGSAPSSDPFLPRLEASHHIFRRPLGASVQAGVGCRGLRGPRSTVWCWAGFS